MSRLQTLKINTRDCPGCTFHNHYDYRVGESTTCDLAKALGGELELDHSQARAPDTCPAIRPGVLVSIEDDMPKT